MDWEITNAALMLLLLVDSEGALIRLIFLCFQSRRQVSHNGGSVRLLMCLWSKGNELSAMAGLGTVAVL